MEIKIGVRNVVREVTLETTSTVAEVTKAFEKALGSNGVLTLNDEKGRTVLIPAAQVGYLDCGSEHARRVGFGAIDS